LSIIIESRLVISHPDDYDSIQGSIGLPVAATVEAMSVRFPARGWNRTGTAEFGESGLGTDAFGIVADEDEHLSRGTRGDPVSFEHGRRARCGQSVEIGVMGLDFGIAHQPAPRYCPQGALGRGCHRGNWSWPQGSQAQKPTVMPGEAVPRHLLPRLTGFELMMAPYAIAHVKIGLKLFDTGYRFGGDARAQIYLTNALEPAQDFDMQLEFMSAALAHEARAANAAATVALLGRLPGSRISGMAI
jgi:hypothetical protein